MMNLNRPYEELLKIIISTLAEMFDQDPERSQAFRQAERVAMNQLGDDAPETGHPGKFSRLIKGSHGGT